MLRSVLPHICSSRVSGPDKSFCGSQAGVFDVPEGKVALFDVEMQLVSSTTSLPSTLKLTFSSLCARTRSLFAVRALAARCVRL